MENLEDAARSAAIRWNDRKAAKEEVRRRAFELLDKKFNMSEVARMMGISRTSLYYILYGLDGKLKSTRRANDPGLPVHAGERDERKSA